MKYEQVTAHIQGLARQIEKSGKQYKAIVAIGRGGMPIASMLAHALGISLCHYVNYSRKHGWLGDSFGDNKPAPGEVLFVDDATETGGTFTALEPHYGKFDCAVITKRTDCDYPVTFWALASNKAEDISMPFEMRGSNEPA